MEHISVALYNSLLEIFGENIIKAKIKENFPEQPFSVSTEKKLTINTSGELENCLYVTGKVKKKHSEIIILDISILPTGGTPGTH